MIHIWLKKAALDTVPVGPDVVVAANKASFDVFLSDFIVIFFQGVFIIKKSFYILPEVLSEYDIGKK